MASSIQGAAADLAGSSGLLGAFKSAFGGNTTRMAQALGATPRTAQRYYTSGKERRAPSPATKEKMARHVGTTARIEGEFFFDTPGGGQDTRKRDVSFNVSRAEMARINDALLAGNDEQARELLFEAYGMAAPDEVIGANYSFSL